MEKLLNNFFTRWREWTWPDWTKRLSTLNIIFLQLFHFRLRHIPEPTWEYLQEVPTYLWTVISCSPQNIHLLHKGKSLCTVDLLFDWFGFDQTRKFVGLGHDQKNLLELVFALTKPWPLHKVKSVLRSHFLPL